MVLTQYMVGYSPLCVATATDDLLWQSEAFHKTRTTTTHSIEGLRPPVSGGRCFVNPPPHRVLA